MCIEERNKFFVRYITLGIERVLLGDGPPIIYFKLVGEKPAGSTIIQWKDFKSTPTKLEQAEKSQENVVSQNHKNLTYKEIKEGQKFDGTAVKKLADISFAANKDKDASQFKKPEELKGYIPDKKLASMGAERKFKEMMTYEEAFNKRYIDGIRWDVDPNRMVWVIQTKFNKDLDFEAGKTMKKPLITNVYDAETGEILDYSWKAANYQP